MLFAGIDWSDQALDYHLRTPDDTVLAEGQVKVNPEGLGELFVALERHAAPDQIGIAIETSHGAWMQSLLDRGYEIYPVNPKATHSCGLFARTIRRSSRCESPVRIASAWSRNERPSSTNCDRS